VLSVSDRNELELERSEFLSIRNLIEIISPVTEMVCGQADLKCCLLRRGD